MKPLVYAALIGLCLVVARPGMAAERIVQEWNFSGASDTLGWTTAGSLEEFAIKDGALVATAGANRQKLISPLFDIPASPHQYVEIELATDAAGTGLMYYSNTTEEPYHGFRTEQYATFNAIGDGQFHTYRILPFWQRHGKIVHIRFDPPGKVARIRAIRIVDTGAGEVSDTTSWKFAGSAAGWTTVTAGMEVKPGVQMCEITGNHETSFLSPAIEVDADEQLWATVRLASKTEHTVMFRWASTDHDGLRSLPFEVRGDGTVHSYSLHLGEVDDWSGSIVAVGVTPSEMPEAKTVQVESISLGKAPSGPAEVQVTRFGIEEPFARVGRPATLVVEATNVGGEPAGSISATATIMYTDPETGTPTNDTRFKTLPGIKPGETVRFKWQIDPKMEGLHAAACRVMGLGVDSSEKRAMLRFYPALDKAAVSTTGYVPEPKPANTGDYLVGAYYFPGWHSYDRWSVLEKFPERTPVLGYYKEGNPEVADWQIKWALEHGISFFIYDWYWDEGVRQLEQGLHDAFFNAKYQDRMKFCLLWANHNKPAKNPESDMIAVTQYWIDNYFKRPNYLKIDGKNVMVIFLPQRLRDDLGSEKMKASFDKMRQMCEEAGVGGLYLVACTYPGADNIKRLEAEGYDALSGYNYPSAGNKGLRRAPYEWMVEGYKDWWGQIADASTIPYIPVCEPGWDSRPWHGEKDLVRTGKSPHLWKTMLENAKAYVDDPKRSKPNDQKIVFLEAWNEFGEGDYIEPHAEFGFDHIEMVRQVFAPQSQEPVIITPEDVGMGPYAIAKPEPKTEWVFSRPDDQGWYVGNMAELCYENGVMKARAINHDPAFYSHLIRIDASKFKAIEIKMKMDKGAEGQLFFTRPRGIMTEEKSLRFPVQADDQFHIYTLDLSKNPRWHGTIGQIRLDPCDEQGSNVEIEYIKFK